MNRDLIRQAQQMQARLAKIQEELESETVEASAGGGAIKVVVTGHQKVLSVVISPDVVDPEDVEMLQDLVMAAVNEGMDKAKELASNRLSTITGGMKLPGMM